MASVKGPAYRVVLNAPDEHYAIASATVYTLGAARTLAVHYLGFVPQGRVRVWTPPHSTDTADWDWDSIEAVGEIEP